MSKFTIASAHLSEPVELYRATNRTVLATAHRQPFGDVLHLFSPTEIRPRAQNGNVRLNLDGFAAKRARGYINVTEASALLSHYDNSVLPV